MNLVLSNAMVYNQFGTVIYKAAQRIKSAAEPIMAELKKLFIAPPHPPFSSLEAPPPIRELSSETGDLEPPLYLLDLMDSSAAIRDDLELVLHSSPLVSLFAYEFGEPKPPPPPPPAKSKAKSKSKSHKKSSAPKKRDRKLEAERRKLRLAAEAAARDTIVDGNLGASYETPGFRAPTSTRAMTRSAAAAFGIELVDGLDGQLQPEAGSSSISMGGEQITGTGTGESEAAVRAKKKAKRLPTTVSAHPHEPQLVKDVNDKDSFILFEGGWILPDGQKRRGRTPVERKVPVLISGGGSKKRKAGEDLPLFFFPSLSMLRY